MPEICRRPSQTRVTAPEPSRSSTSSAGCPARGLMVTVEMVPVSCTCCRSSQERIGTAPSARTVSCISSASSSAFDDANRRKARCSTFSLSHVHPHLSLGPTSSRRIAPRSTSVGSSPRAVGGRHVQRQQVARRHRLVAAADDDLPECGQHVGTDRASSGPPRPPPVRRRCRAAASGALGHPHPGRLVALLAVRGGHRHQPAQLDPERVPRRARPIRPRRSRVSMISSRSSAHRPPLRGAAYAPSSRAEEYAVAPGSVSPAAPRRSR